VKMPYFHVLFGFGFSVLQLGHLAISDHFYGCCFWGIYNLLLLLFILGFYNGFR
jgi:hypothetical protein